MILIYQLNILTQFSYSKFLEYITTLLEFGV